MKIKRELTQMAAKVKGKLTHIFDPDQLQVLARQSGFVQRSTSQLAGPEFVELMSTEMIADAAVSLDGLCDILRQLNPQAMMTPQALHQRLLAPQAETYLHEVLCLALRANLEPIGRPLSADLLKPFGRVFLQDSTQCRLHEKLAERFRGSGGSASSSAVKIDLIYNYTQHVIRELHITEGRTPDQCRAEAIVSHLQSGDLVLRDLGYFQLHALHQIHATSAFFLSRLLKAADVFLSWHEQAAALDLVAHLQQYYPTHTVIDLDVFVGQEARLPCRLVAYRLPEAVVAKRRRSAYEVASKKGRTPTRAYLDWLQYGCYITNVSRDVWRAEVVATVYRLRWAVELIFKNWKSLLHLHVLKGTRTERVACLLYGRLITIALMTMLYAYASWYAESYLQREASAHKLINWLKRKERFANAVHEGTFDELLQALLHDISIMLCKQKRKRRTSLELIEDHAEFMEHFLQDETAPLAKTA